MVVEQTSNKTAVFDKKPWVKHGYYAGKLLEYKKRQTEEGIDVEGMYGKQAIALWEVYSEDGKEKILGFNKEPIILAQVLNRSYKDKKTGEENSAFTPNSKITKTFMALGWSGPDGKTLNTDDYIGRFAVLNIDDYEAKRNDAEGKEEIYKASAIKEVNKFEGEIPQLVKIKEKMEEEIIDFAIHKEETPNGKIDNITKEEYDKRVAWLNRLHEKGNISQRGYELALGALKDQLEGR